MKIADLSAREMLENLEAGELSSREIVAALLARGDEIEPAVDALVHRFDDRARRRAREADRARSRGERWGPLHGLPVTVKESIDTRGVASTLGLASRRDRIAEDDAVVVRAALDAGAILLGKTNVPQTLASPVHTVNPIWGRTRNPWRTTHSSGGSSGGEAAALASGASVLGIGTDIGGSIRVPAAFCGVLGLKPTDGRWSNLGANSFLEGVGVAGSQTGPMARNCGDLRLLFRTLSGPAQTELDPAVPPLPETAGEPDVLDLRVGFYEHDGFFPPSPAVRRAVREAVALLEQRGVEVVFYRPPFPEEVPYLMFQAAMADGGRSFRDQLADEDEIIEPVRNVLRLSRFPRILLEVLIALLRLQGDERAAKLLASFRKRDLRELLLRTREIRREELRRWNEEGLDAVLCPVFPTPAAPHELGQDLTIAFSYTVRFNLTRMPAGVVPLTRVGPGETVRAEIEDRLEREAAEIDALSEGLPVGIQVVGRPWREDLVLRLMAVIEEDARTRPDYPVTPVSPVCGGNEG